MSAVTSRFRAEWNNHCLTLRNTFDFAFEDAELRRIDQVVCGVHGEQWSADLFQIGPWIVITG